MEVDGGGWVGGLEHDRVGTGRGMGSGCEMGCGKVNAE